MFLNFYVPNIGSQNVIKANTIGHKGPHIIMVDNSNTQLSSLD